jgi:DNA polymerase-1
MIKAFLNNEDIHKSTASKVFDVPLEEVTREQEAMRKRLISNYIWSLGVRTQQSNQLVT